DHDLYARVRELACERNPALSWEQIAELGGAPSADDLVTWLLRYRLPPALAALERANLRPRDVTLHAELNRLRDRQASLLTVGSQAPRELAIVQRRIKSLERAR